MRMDAVVEPPPFLDDHEGLRHAQEDLLVETFTPEPVVEAVHVAVLMLCERPSGGPMGRLCRCAPFVLPLFEAPGVGDLLLAPTVEGLLADIGLVADLLDSLPAVGQS